MSANTVWQRLLSFFPEVLKGNSGAAPAVDWTAGSVQSLTLNAATVTPTFTAPPGGASLALVLTQDGTGGRAVTWPAAVSWIGGTPPILLSGAGQTTLVYFYFDGTTYWGSLQSGASPASIIPWTAVAAGTALAASLAKPNLAADSSGAQSTITLPTAVQMASSDGYEFTIKATGNMVAPIIVAAGAGTTLELLNAPGTFGASTWLPIQGQGVVFKYDLATTTWKMRANSEGSGAAGLSAYNPGWYAAGTLFVDPVAGSDSNSGVVSGAPLKKYAEAVRRWGAVDPDLFVTTSLTFLSSHADNTDPVTWRPRAHAGAVMSIQGTTPGVTAAVFTRNAAKNRAAGSNAMLSGSFSAGAPAAGVMIENTTAGKSSRTVIHSSAGGANWNLCQPMSKLAVPTTAFPSEVDTWASADTVNVLSLVKINLVEFSPFCVDLNGSSDNNGYLYQFRGLDPSGTPGTNVTFVSGFVQVQECVFERSVSYVGQGGVPPNAIASSFYSSYYLGGLFSGAANTTNPINVVGGGTNNGIIIIGGTIDGDFIAGGFIAEFGAYVEIGFMFMDTNCQPQPGSLVQFETVLYGGHVIYGTTGKNWNFIGKSRGAVTSGTYAAGWTQATMIATGVQLNGTSTGQTHTNASPDVVTSAVATTVANADAANGGDMQKWGGASISKSL